MTSYRVLPQRAAIFHSRTKSVEWLMSGFMIAWAVTLIYPGNTLSLPGYVEFRAIGLDENKLIIFYLTVGVCRIVALYRNGSFIRGPQIRLICCAIGAFTWSFSAILFITPMLIGLTPLSVLVGFHVVLFFGELYSAGVSAVDRRIQRS